jgi:ribonuclease III
VTNHLASLAREFGLLMTGGTDFHGDLKPDTRLGTGSGDFFVPYALYEKLQIQIDQTIAGQPHIQPMTDNKKKPSAQTDSAMPPLSELESILGYHFQNQLLLEKALTHPTYAHEHPNPELKDNQRLEFLGDAVLNLVVGHLLMIHDPNAREGELTLMRASLVSESGLAEIAQGMNLGAHIKLGVGELATHGREKKSILADTLEAIMAALYLDGGYEKAFIIIETLFAPFLGNHKPDPKTDLQERVQKKHGGIPVYRVMDETGPAHDKTFTIELKVGELITVGTGKSKKSAEKSAAEKALKRLSEIDG